MSSTVVLPIKIGSLEVRLANGADEIAAAEELRHEVFYRRNGARPSPEVARTGRDHDSYDDICDHLLVVETDTSQSAVFVLGTYRFIGDWMLGPHGRFYSEAEFDLGQLRRAIPSGLLEVGRACVHPNFQGGTVLKNLWRGIAAYVAEHKVGYLMGCGSFPGVDPDAHGYWLDKLYRERLIPQDRLVRALPERYVPMRRDAPMPAGEPPELPKLIQGYLRLGEAWVGDGAVVDFDFNTVDVFLLVSTAGLLARYKNFFLRGQE